MEFLCSFYLPKFLFCSTFTSTFLCLYSGDHLLPQIRCQEKCHDKRNTERCHLGPPLAARLSWYRALSRSPLRKGWWSRKAQHQELQPRKAWWLGGKHKARGKHQTGKQDLTQRGEEIKSMLFASYSSLFLSSRLFLNSCF